MRRPWPCRTFHFGDVNAVVEGLRYGAGFVVFVRGGRSDRDTRLVPREPTGCEGLSEEDLRKLVGLPALHPRQLAVKTGLKPVTPDTTR